MAEDAGDPHALKRVTTWVEQRQLDALHQIQKKRRWRMAEMIRTAIDEYLEARIKIVTLDAVPPAAEQDDPVDPSA